MGGSTFIDFVEVVEVLSGARIEEGAITTPKLYAGAVVADKIAANAVRSEHIETRAVVTEKLAARSVTAATVAIADRENLFPDGAFDQADTSILASNSGSPPPYAAFTTYYPSEGKNSLVWAPPDTDFHYLELRPDFGPSVAAGASYGFSIRLADGVGAGLIAVSLTFRDKDNLYISAIPIISQGTILTSSSVEYSGQIVAPPNAATAGWTIINYEGGPSAAYLVIDYVRLRRAGLGLLLVDGDVKANNIAADAVTSATIAAGAVNTRELAAGAVTTDKMLITGRGTALNDDPNTQDATAWGGGAFSIVVQDDAPAGRTVLRATGGAHIVTTRTFAVTAGNQYRLRGWARKNADAEANGGYYLRAYFYNGVGSQLLYAPAAEGVLLTTDWQLFDALVTAPAGATQAHLYTIHNYLGTDGYHEAQGIRFEEAVDAALIVDGAIAADKIATDAVTADKIVARAVVAEKIAAGSVTADKLNVESVSVAGLAVFGDELKSADFLAGSSGWSIKNNGDAEFNSLLVRQDMLVRGAVSTSRIISEVSSTTITATTAGTARRLGDVVNDVVLKPSHEPNPYFSPIAGSLGDRPLQVTITASLKATTGPAAIYFSLEGYVELNDTWYSLNIEPLTKTVIPTAMAGFSFCQTLSAFTGGWAADLEFYKKLRLKAYVEPASPFSSRSIIVERVTCLLQQLTR